MHQFLFIAYHWICENWRQPIYLTLLVSLVKTWYIPTITYSLPNIKGINLKLTTDFDKIPDMMHQFLFIAYR
jgi:hypothetical protein